MNNQNELDDDEHLDDQGWNEVYASFEDGNESPEASKFEKEQLKEIYDIDLAIAS